MLLAAAALAVLQSLGLSPGVRTGAVQAPGTTPGDLPVLAVPDRRKPDAPPKPPPELPAGADRVAPLTLETLVRRQPRRGHVQTLRQVVTRTSDRIHVRAGDGREWLFERNPRDPRRVLGTVVEHAARSIVVYDESDLRNLQGVRGWAQVLALGYDIEALKTLRRTAQSRTIAGVRFTKYAAAGSRSAEPELWWNDDFILPGAFVTADRLGATRFSIVRLRSGVDASLLRPPTSRFPAYQVLDLADWLERR